MTLHTVKQAGRWTGRAAAVLAAVFLLVLLDAAFARMRQPSDSVACLQGGSAAVTGRLPDGAGLSRLAFRSDDAGVGVAFDGEQTGYVLGGRVWRGRVVVGSGVGPGLHEATVLAPGGRPATFRVSVFADEAGLKAASPSYAVRYAGAGPLSLALFLAPFVALSFLAVFLLSGVEARLMAREGRAEIWRVAEGENGREIHFCLDGVAAGDLLALFDGKDRLSGTAVVHEVFAGRAVAVAGQGSIVRPGFTVLLPG